MSKTENRLEALKGMCLDFLLFLVLPIIFYILTNFFPENLPKMNKTPIVLGLIIFIGINFENLKQLLTGKVGRKRRRMLENEEEIKKILEEKEEKK
jgi:hypothetical protein